MKPDLAIFKTSLLLALAGSAASLFSVFALPHLGAANIAPGLVLGVALTLYFVAIERRTDALALCLLVAVCTLAWPAALIGGFGFDRILLAPATTTDSITTTSIRAVFIGGMIGSFLVIGGATLLFRRSSINGRTLLLVFLSALVGGVLAAATIHASKIGSPAQTLKYVFLIWQPGVGALLGLLPTLSQQAPRSSLELPIPAYTEPHVVPPLRNYVLDNGPNPKLIGLAVLSLLIGVIALWLFSAARSQREIAQQTNRQHSIEEAHPSEDPWPTETLQIEQVLILQDIGVYSPIVSYSDPPDRRHREFVVDYGVKNSVERQKWSPRAASVKVTQSGSPQWSRYLAMNPRLNLAVISPQSLSNVTKLGQHLIQDIYVSTCFHWPSNQFLVSVCFDAEIHDEFLKAYLAKYPSSL